jgi:hypothetical protein
MSIIQSVVFKKEYGLHKARAWLGKHGLSHTKVDDTGNTLRFRQYEPESLKTMGYRFRTEPFAHGSLIIAFPPAKK